LLLCLFPGLAPWAFLSRPFGASFAPETSISIHRNVYVFNDQSSFIGALQAVG